MVRPDDLTVRMHDDEVPIDAALVARLVAEQFPGLSSLPVREVQSTGTVNAVYRLGDQLCARLPRVPSWASDLDREWQWLPHLGPRVSLDVPEPLERGAASSTYPLAWSIYRWLPGEPYADSLIRDEAKAARTLATFVTELRSVDTASSAPPAGRRPLAELDPDTRAAIGESSGMIDTAAVALAWRRALDAPVFAGAPVWIHSDLLRPNLLVHQGRISAVIDFGSVGVGDPAADVIAAWSVFGPAGRAVYRDGLAVDDSTWERACGFALHQAVMLIPYYAVTNPGMAALGRRTVQQILLDQTLRS